LINALRTTFIPQNNKREYYITNGVDKDFQQSVFRAVKNMENFSSKSHKAVSKLQNVIILKNSDSFIPDSFSKTRNKLQTLAQDAYGFVSKSDNAIVINENNHLRKDCSFEGSLSEQASDTLTHEVGHLMDEEFSTSDSFKNAYLKDLKNIEKLQKEKQDILGENIDEMISYFKHYMEGVDFSDGIDEKDITREGLRENFAECFSTIADSSPSKVNSIFSSLFPNTMKETYRFVIQ